MLSILFNRQKKPEPAPSAPGRFDVEGTVYAIGDIHGCAPLLKHLLRKLVDDAAKPHTVWPINIVFVGDYVDRGKHSRETLGILRSLEEETDVSVTFIKGNHEAMLLDFIIDPLRGRDWLINGGLQTLESFGVRGAPPSAPDQTLLECAASLRESMGELYGFLTSRTVLSRRIGNVFICHAAVDPDRPLEVQDERVLLWGNRRFMHTGGPPGYWIVHGHTIVDEAALYGSRVAVDTGAFQGGPLTAARIESGPAETGCTFIQARRSEFPR